MLKEINLARVDLNLLVVFEAVLASRHVGRAAERLNLTPSAVSHGLARLRRLFNDPLFLRTPKGVVPTPRALELAAPVADILIRARNVIAIAEPFNPATSARRFTLGAPDGISAVSLPPLLAELRQHAPGVDLSLRQLLPVPGEASAERAWRNVFADLDGRALDVAVIPSAPVARRFQSRLLYEEKFVIAMRGRHPFAADPTLDRYCDMRHALVSLSGDAEGFVDKALAKRRRTRRIALTVPSFMFALAVIAETDLIAALPSQFVAMHGPRFGVVAVESPLPLPSYRISVIAAKSALMGSGVAWLFEVFADKRRALWRRLKH